MAGDNAASSSPVSSLGPKHHNCELQTRSSEDTSRVLTSNQTQSIEPIPSSESETLSEDMISSPSPPLSSKVEVKRQDILIRSTRDLSSDVPTCCQGINTFCGYVTSCFFMGTLLPISIIILTTTNIFVTSTTDRLYIPLIAISSIILFVAVVYFLWNIRSFLRDGLPCNTPSPAPPTSSISATGTWTKKSVKNIYIILNSMGGTGLASTILSQVLLPALHHNNITYTVIPTEYAGHSQVLAHTLDFVGFDALAIIGGDGSIMEVVSGMASRPDKQSIPIAIIPGGSGNSFMADLGCWVVSSAVDWLINGEVVSIDANHVTDDGGELDIYSINVVALGLIKDAATTAEVHRWLGPMRYDICGFWALLKHQTELVHLQYVDENDDTIDSTEEMITAFVNHSQFFGKGLRAAPYSKMNDGLAELIFASNTTRGDLLAIFSQLPTGAHVNNPNIHIKKVKKCSLITPKPQGSLTIDGETFGRTGAVHVECIPNAVEIFCPQDTVPLSDPSTNKIKLFSSIEEEIRYRKMQKDS